MPILVLVLAVVGAALPWFPLSGFSSDVLMLHDGAAVAFGGESLATVALTFALAMLGMLAVTGRNVHVAWLLLIPLARVGSAAVWAAGELVGYWRIAQEVGDPRTTRSLVDGTGYVGKPLGWATLVVAGSLLPVGLALLGSGAADSGGKRSGRAIVHAFVWAALATAMGFASGLGRPNTLVVVGGVALAAGLCVALAPAPGEQDERRDQWFVGVAALAVAAALASVGLAAARLGARCERALDAGITPDLDMVAQAIGGAGVLAAGGLVAAIGPIAAMFVRSPRSPGGGSIRLSRRLGISAVVLCGLLPLGCLVALVLLASRAQ